MNKRPDQSEYAPYFSKYVSIVPGDDFIACLQSNEALELYKALTEEQWDHRYAAGKWSLREVLVHVMDTERIFAYRALRISRNDMTPLQGFEQDDYVPYYSSGTRSSDSLIKEYEAVRAATLSMFENFDRDHLARVGVASGHKVSTRALGYMIAGHEIHHHGINRTKYLRLT